MNFKSHHFFPAALILGTLCSLLVFHLPSYAELYRWEDESGVVHFTDDISQIPEKQRRKLYKDGSLTPYEGSSDSNISLIPSGDSSDSTKKDIDEELSSDETEDENEGDESNSKAYWQKRVQDTKNQLAKAERDLEGIQKQVRDNLESGPGMQERQAKFSKKESDLEDKIEELKEELETGLPDEARRQGVPPQAI